MKSISTGFAAIATAAALTAAPALADRMPEDSNNVATTCNGQLFGGDYIVDPVTTVAPLTADMFNIIAGENLVGTVTPLVRDLLVVSPANPATDCHTFMQHMEDTGVVENIEPNYIIGLSSPMP